MTITRTQFFAAVDRAGLLTPAYAEDVLVRIAHHSSAIEGNTLTVADTITLLVDELVPTAGKPLRELYEVANHREAFTIVLEHAATNEPLTVSVILAVHAALTDHILEDKGTWKTTQNAILGALTQTAEPAQVPWLMQQWAENASWQADNLTGSHALQAIADAHAEFERIHPFSDGNGRTGRLLLMWQSLRAFGLPIIIEPAQRTTYIQALRDDDRAALAGLLARCLLTENTRARSFDTHTREEPQHPVTTVTGASPSDADRGPAIRTPGLPQPVSTTSTHQTAEPPTLRDPHGPTPR